MFSRSRRSFVSRLGVAITVGASLVLTSLPATAQRSVPVVRDAEIERYVEDVASPILKAAGLQSGVDLILVNDHRFNAFVAGRRIFLHTGALLTAETPNEIAGVLAHEAGHIAGGHQERLRQQMARAQTMAVVAMLAGIGAGVAGAAADLPGLPQAGMGIAAGGTEAARRSVLGYQRGEELTADRTAIEYLNRTKQSAAGMLKTFDRMARDLSLSGVNVDPYQSSHPMPRDRLATLETLARQSPYYAVQDPAALRTRHDLVRAKIAAYTGGANAVRRVFRGQSNNLGAVYGETIATYLNGSSRDALARVERLIAAQPSNPYFHELKGEILLKANNPAAAANAYAKAIQLAPGNPGLLQIGYGRALLATGQPEHVRKAAEILKAALTREPEYAAGYRFLAQAYGQLGDVGAAELATAEGHYHSGQVREAKIFAARAQQRLQRGTPNWLRAQDIINARN
ncbi:M48 family metalloprotease [Nitratireductor basaltis]|nr:M48 family metalloprotease [Nitratireductor basaltis]